MRQLLIVILASVLVFFSIHVMADELKLKPDAPLVYEVKAGDTLWDIAGLYLSQPWLWPRLWKLNPQVHNPHLIYPGDKLHLQFDENGQPVLSRNMPVAQAIQAADIDETPPSLTTVLKLKPQIRRSAKSSQAIATIALSEIKPLLAEEQLVSKQQLEDLPYVLGGQQNIKNAVSGHVLYVQGVLNPAINYGIYRQGETYEDPQSGDSLGYAAVLVAEAKVLPEVEVNSNSQNISRIAVQKSRREVRQGDRLLPLPELSTYPEFFQLMQPEQKVSGQIVASASQWREFAKGEVVLLNQGANAHLLPGHLLGVYRSSPAVVDSGDKPAYPEDSNKLQRILHELVGAAEQMPTELVGQLMVLRVSEHSSFAMVLRSEQSVRVGDVIGNL